MVTISTPTIIENVFKNFLDLMKANVDSITIDNRGVADAKTITIQTYTSSFTNALLDSQSDYPILVVNSPVPGVGSIKTYGKSTYDGPIDIEIFTTQAPTADKFLSQIMDAVESNLQTLYGQGLRMVELDSTDSDNFQRDGNAFTTHYRRARYNISYTYTRSQYT